MSDSEVLENMDGEENGKREKWLEKERTDYENYMGLSNWIPFKRWKKRMDLLLLLFIST